MLHTCLQLSTAHGVTCASRQVQAPLPSVSFSRPCPPSSLINDMPYLQADERQAAAVMAPPWRRQGSRGPGRGGGGAPAGREAWGPAPAGTLWGGRAAVMALGGSSGDEEDVSDTDQQVGGMCGMCSAAQWWQNILGAVVMQNSRHHLLFPVQL